MTVYELMAKLGAAGIKLWVEEGSLKFKAPKGALTPDLKQHLVENKQPVIDFLSESRMDATAGNDVIPQVDRSKPVPLSQAQQRLWFVEQLTPGSSTFHIPAALYLNGILDRKALENAFVELMKRHESLRTVFVTDADQPYQLVQHLEQFPIPVDTLLDIPSDQREEEVKKRVETEVRTSFDLEKGPLIRAHLYQLDDNRHGLIVTMHHIITDGWSMGIFVREISALYAGQRMGMKVPLPELAIQYGDFSSWQREWLQGGELDRQLGYWAKQLGNAPEQLALPFDRPRHALQTLNGATIDVSLSDSLTVGLRRLARQFDTTLYVILMVGFKVVLSKWAKQQDVCVGMPVAGRTRAEVENLIGFFVNTLVIRTKLSGNPTLEDLVRQAKENILGAQSHQDLPFEAIVDELNVPRNLSFPPLYQVAFSLTSDEGTAKKASLGGLEIEPMPIELVAARLDLTMMLVDDSHSISGMFEYNTDLFDRSTIEQFLLHFENALQAMVDDVHQRIEPLSLLSQKELVAVVCPDREVDAVLSLAPMQRDFCLDSLREPETRRNSIGYAVQLPFEVDEQRWCNALSEVHRANPFLRSIMMSCDYPGLDSFYQVIEKAGSVPLTRMRWDGDSLTEFNVVEELEGIALTAWDIEGQPLWKNYLLDCKDGTTWAVSAAHHSISDGVTKYFHFTQILAAYKGESILHHSVDDAEKWLGKRIGETDTQDTLTFWGGQLKEFESVAVKAQDAGSAEVLKWTLNQENLDQVSMWCETNGCGFAGYLRTLYSLALQQCYFDAEPFVLIDAVSGREDGQALWAGCAFQFVPFVQTKLASNLPSFVEMVRANRSWKKSVGNSQYLSMYSRKDYIDSNALEFQFNFRMPMVGESLQFESHSLNVNLIQPDNPGTVKLLVTSKESETEVRLSYHKNEFKGFDLLQRMQRVHQQIMSGVDSVGDFNWMLDGEEPLLSQMGSGEKSILSKNFLTSIEEMAESYSDSVAVICGTERVSYLALWQRSNQLANWIASKGLTVQDRVAICVGRSHQLPIVYLGAVKSPAAYVPLDTSYPADRIQYIVDNCAAKIFITERCILNRLDEAGAVLPESVEVILMEEIEEKLNSVSQENPLYKPALTDPLYYVYTSGSTGKPKGAGVYYSGESNLLSWYQDQLQCDQSDRVLLASAVGFDLTQKNLFVAFCAGAALVIPGSDDYDPELYGQIVAENGVSIINCAPSAFYPIINKDYDGYPFPSIRQVVLGGEPIRVSAVQDWLNDDRVNASITNSYGPTECTDVVASHSVSHLETVDFIFPIGSPIQNTQLYVTNKKGQLMPRGASGELRVAGSGVGSGYWRLPELTQSVFTENPFGNGQWYQTGDICRFSGEELVYVGRTDFQVKLRGLRIEPDEINSQLKTIEFISDALTLVKDDRLISYVLINKALTTKQIDVDRVKNALRKNLPEFMVPSSVVSLLEWPLTPNGKIDRKNLPEPLLDEDVEFISPRNESERIIADIWCQVLKVPQISVKANFFETGGHSLLATQVVSRIRKAFGIELSVRVLFESPTVEKLVHAISTASAAGLHDSAPDMVALDPPNRDTLSFAQYRLWFVDQLNQGSSEYNLPSAMRVKGALNTNVLVQVFTEIVSRHEVLRTNFSEDDGVPRLLVRDVDSWDLPLTDLSQLPEKEKQKRITSLVDDDAAKVFSLKDDLLFTTQLLKLHDDDHILLLNMHHIISDGWSLGVLVQEIQALYTAFEAGKSSPLPPLLIQYSDFSVWQRNWIQADVLDSMRTYWQEALRGAPDVLRLPTDKPRPKHQTFNGAHFETGLGSELSTQLNRFCDQHDLTPFMVLMGAYQLLLSRYSHQKDICVGIPIAGRNRAEIEGLIGFFINGLVIRTRMDDNPKVLDYIKQVKTVSLGAYSNQDMPADLLLDAIKMERTADTSPGAQVGFALQNVAQEKISTGMSGLTIEAVAREHKTSKYELSLILQENEGVFSGVAEYNTDLFVESTIERMMCHFNRIVEQVINEPDLLIDQLQLIKAEEFYSLLAVDNRQSELKPLSPMQRDMYLDSLVNPDTLKNSLGYHFITRGEFDETVWQKAIQMVVSDQPLLRAKILPSSLPYSDVAYLKVDREKTVNLIVEDWSAKNTSDVEAAAYAKSLIWKPYNIEGELSQYFVVRLDNHRYMVVFRMNHIILDGAGMAVHLNNCISAAESIKSSASYIPAEQFFDQYVHDSRKRVDATDVIHYWKEKGQQVDALDFSLPSSVNIDSSERVEKSLSISDEHWSAITDYCSRSKITPSLYFKAIYGLLINAYCRGESDFYISEIVGGRVGANRRAFGNYFQVLPVVFEQALFDKTTSITELFSYIRQYRKSLRSNANVSLLGQRQYLPQGRQHFMFNYYNFIPSVSLFGSQVDLKAYPQVQDGPIQFVVQEQSGGVELNLIYLSDLFEDLGFLKRIESVSRQIVEGVGVVSELNLLLKEELQSQTNTKVIDPPLGFETVVHGFERQAKNSPESVAVKCGENVLTYAELDTQSDQLARWLLEQGVQSGDHVGICLDRSVSLLVAVFAAIKARAAYVPMDSSYPEERLAHILKDSNAPVLITQKSVHKRIQSAVAQLNNTLVLEIDSDLSWMDVSKGVSLEKPSPQDVIYAIYTSGSTGTPKGALVTHGGEINLQQWYLNSLQVGDQDKFLLMSAFGFDLTQKNLFAPLLVGASLIIPEMKQYDIEVLADTLVDEKITIVNCAPSAFYPIAQNTQQRGYPFSDLRYLVLGGEPIRIDALMGWLKQSQCALINSYGPTECTDVVAYHQWSEDDEAGYIPIGRPINNTELYVVDSCDHKLPAGIVGELCIGGSGVGLGYLNQAELSAAVFQQNPYGKGNWYRSGDLARYDAKGNIEYIGRLDFQVKLRGLRIELGEIESVLNRQPEIKASITLVKDDRLISYVIAPAALDVTNLKKTLHQSLPDYMIPSAINTLSSWPLTPNGKIDRDALPDVEESSRQEYVAPRNDTEEKLVSIWSEVLGVEKIGVNDSFFDLGGHSLLAARAVSKLRQTFEIDIQLRSLFELHTIADIAQYIDTMKWAALSAEQAQQQDDENRDEGLL